MVLSPVGGFGVETETFVKKLVEKVAEKKGNAPSVVSSNVRFKNSFELVRSQVACIGGARKMKKMEVDTF